MEKSRFSFDGIRFLKYYQFTLNYPKYLII